ncbi:MAG: methylmalonyl-CoA mutase, partial [Rhizobiales bacterium]|nr:methylmalonyl-CoA mutase [Hyphomicrobiales bacterium]
WWDKSASEAGCTVGFGIDSIAGAATGRMDVCRLAERALAWDAGVVRYAIDAAPGALVLKASGLPYHKSGASEAQELGVMLAAAIACLRACEMQQITPQDAASRVELELAADAELFLTIAKLRAARLLWARLGEECGFASPARLGVQTSARIMCVSDPQTNMVRTSIAALGAGIGGADALTILPFTHAIGRPDAYARRIARNTAHILSDEARIGEVADAAAGSWAIESFTHALCEAAWNVFTQIESEGGIVQSLLSGSLQGRIATSRAGLVADIAEGRRVLVGATDYKPESVPAVTVEPWSTPPQIDGSVPTLRPIRLEGGS